MIQQLSIKLSNMIIQNDLGDKENFDWYVYGFENLLSKLINFPILFLVGLCLGKPFEGVVFLLFFTLLRIRTGGYHAPARWVCTLVSAAIVALCLGLVIWMPPGLLTLLLALLPPSGAVIFLIAPVNHPDLHMDGEELRQNRRISRITVFAQGAIITAMFILGAPPSLTAMASLGIIMDAIGILLAKILRQEIKA